MKSPEFFRRGVALILVLCLIVLLSAMIMAFMSSARNELVATTYYEAGQEAQGLSETAVNIVMAQIREATLSGITAQGEGRHAWASQPGALRVWDDDGRLVQIYKLYSAARLKATSGNFLSGEIPSAWRDQPDAFVDINEPVATGSGTGLAWHYPILNPDALGEVEGFSSQQVQEPTIVWNSKTSMPVRWLYVGRSGNFSDTLQPDSIGRIAFWTDDETCKVNINTASATASLSTIISFPPGSSTAGSPSRLGYSYWDLPYTQIVQDWNMARSVPSQAEYQRYPGHPASVNLLTVLAPSFVGLSESDQKTTLKDVFNLFPAYRWGGSENGRIPWTLAASRIPLSGTSQRLYASVDELRFKPTVSGALRDPNAFPDGAQTDEARLDFWRFFLTAHSRSPELNLFGQPRLTIWPVSAYENDPLYRTTQDNLIAFCSTFGSKSGGSQKEYFFQRKNPLSQTVDWTEIPRNRELLSYLRDLTSRRIPGFGGNFLEKYDIANGGVAGERDQILTEIFDYIRCVNLNEAYDGQPAGFHSYTPTVDVPPSAQSDVAAYNTWNDVNYPSYKGAGMVLPILINAYGTRGAGRVPVLSEVALFAMQQGLPPVPPASDPEPSNRIQTALFFETFSPMQGYMPWSPKDFQMTVKTDMTVAGDEVFPNASVGVTTSPFNRSIAASPGNTANQPIGGTDGFAWTMGIYPGIYEDSLAYPFARHRNNSIAAPPLAPGDPEELPVSSSGMSVDLVMAGLSYQSYQLQFPNLPIQIPQPSPATPQTASNSDWMQRRSHYGMQFKAEDVVQSIVPKDGDYRIIAYLQEVPAGFFRPHPDYGNSHFAHSLRQRKSFGQMGASINDGTSNGSFVNLPYAKVDISSGSNFWTGNPPGYFWTDHPDIPPDITDLIGSGWAGDWNNGLGDFPDGAYLGKSDDGMRSIVASALYLSSEFNWYSGAGFFSPTQQMPSAVMFGSLPTGVKRTEAAYRLGNDSDVQPWRTLLFCPNPAKGSGHFGFGVPAEGPPFTIPPDHLLLDLFTMPVVEPYAISEPASTAGRINMNYQIVPFTTIERTTGLRAVLSSQRVTAIPDSLAVSRNGHPDLTTQAAIQADTTRIRHQIDPTETLKQFADRFSGGDVFRSASEICSLFLVPTGKTLADTANWWTTHRVTGDNLRERPYATLLPLLTTKSNTYTVHVWAQSLSPGKNKVTGEYRGSTTIERYIDPGDSRLTDGHEDPDHKSLEPLYRFRVIENKRFSP